MRERKDGSHRGAELPPLCAIFSSLAEPAPDLLKVLLPRRI